jgi:hypothetical protein
VRNLDAINPAFMKPSKFASVSACTLLALVVLSVPLAYVGAPDIPLAENPIIVVVCITLAASSVLALVSATFGWGWKAKYYGVSLICVASISFIAVVPCVAVLLYGNGSYWVKACILSLYGPTHFFWCRKFYITYKKIFHDKDLRSVIFEEESDAVYYMRRGDDFILEKHLKFSQMPKDRYFVLFIVLALFMMPIMSFVRVIVGAPFVIVFLMVSMLPVSWMSIGLAFRGFLIFYYYPGLIK